MTQLQTKRIRWEDLLKYKTAESLSHDDQKQCSNWMKRKFSLVKPCDLQRKEKFLLSKIYKIKRWKSSTCFDDWDLNVSCRSTWSLEVAGYAAQGAMHLHLRTFQVDGIDGVQNGKENQWLARLFFFLCFFFEFHDFQNDVSGFLNELHEFLRDLFNVLIWNNQVQD